MDTEFDFIEYYEERGLTVRVGSAAKKHVWHDGMKATPLPESCAERNIFSYPLPGIYRAWRSEAKCMPLHRPLKNRPGNFLTNDM